MSIDYVFHVIDIDCEFDTEQEAKDHIKNFNNRVEITNQEAEEAGECRLCCYADLTDYHRPDSNKPLVHIFCDAENDEWVNVDALQPLISECFPNGDGYISYAWATTSASGYVHECGGGRMEYDKGKWSE